MPAYYNEFDPFAAEWLRYLIAAGMIAPGDVDERSIEDISPDDLRPYTQCHFFAGIGVWSYALRQAGWTDDRPIWTGSCPCQPFSAAGKGGGFADERHLWPAFLHLIRAIRPKRVLGEQVASKDGLAWLDLVQSDMEGEGYAFGAVDLCAAGVGAPHIRQRSYWVADQGMADTEGSGRKGRALRQSPGRSSGRIASVSSVDGMADAPSGIDGGERAQSDFGSMAGSDGALQAAPGQPGPVNGEWGLADWLYCRDGKWRAVEPGSFPLVNGASGRVGRLRGYGNAIVAPVAQAFIEAIGD